MKLKIPFSILLLGVLLVPGFAVGEDYKAVGWDDLVPADVTFDDPFTRLSADQIADLSLIAMIRGLIARGREVSEESLAEKRQLEQSLSDQGIDVDGLIAMREQVAAEREAKMSMVNPQLDGTRVRMPGYVVPLEFDDTRVTEFFLVPYVGACIHTPPPPPNQIVHVKLSEGLEAYGGLFTPVWVKGVMRTEQRKSELFLVDGSSDVPSSYSISATLVEKYEP